MLSRTFFTFLKIFLAPYLLLMHFRVMIEEIAYEKVPCSLADKDFLIQELVVFKKNLKEICEIEVKLEKNDDLV